MTDVKETEEQALPIDSPEDEINLLEYLLVIVKQKRMIFRACVITFILACGITLLLPNIYTSTARILPPQETQGGLSGSLGGGLSDLAAMAGVSVGSASGDLYVGMLRSRTIADKIIDHFDLMTVYDEDYRVKMYGKLDDLVNISLGEEDGIVAISVDDENPVRAAEIANAYVEELKSLNVKINLNNAGRERLFLEERLLQVKKELLATEESLKLFQEKNKTIRIDDQATAIIEAIASLKGDLASKEVELGVLLSSQTEQNPQVIALREGVLQLKEQLSQLEHSPEGEKVSGDIFLATSAIPGLGVQYARLLRDFKVEEALFEMLTQQYEVAKITEAKNTSTIQVLDEGVVADKKSKPSRSIIVLLATFVVGFFAVLFAFIREYGQRMSDEDRIIWQEVKQNMKIRDVYRDKKDVGDNVR